MLCFNQCLFFSWRILCHWTWLIFLALGILCISIPAVKFAFGFPINFGRLHCFSLPLQKWFWFFRPICGSVIHDWFLGRFFWRIAHIFWLCFGLGLLSFRFWFCLCNFFGWLFNLDYFYNFRSSGWGFHRNLFCLRFRLVDLIWSLIFLIFGWFDRFFCGCSFFSFFKSFTRVVFLAFFE